MFSFYGGATKRISLDNLKTGILKAHLTDPTVNTAYGELCEYYGVFADPCRVARPEEKGKVERFIAQARGLFRRLVSLHPEASLEELSDRALLRCTDEYGTKPHGTTGLPPARTFALEKPSLLPRAYVGKRVTVRISGGLVRIFFQEKEIRRYTVPSGHRSYREEDFPESSRALMNGTYPEFLKRSAREKFGEAAADFIALVLKPNANLNARRALAFFPLFKRFFDLPLFSTVAREAVSRRNLPGMADNLDLRIREAEENRLGYLDFFSLLVQDEVLNREANTLDKRLKAAGFSHECTFEDFDFEFNSSVLPPPLVRDIASCHFIERHKNLVLAGPPGIGKSHSAQAVGHEAARRGIDVLFVKTHKLLGRLQDLQHPHRAQRS
jgi:hypothetical protein